jgi:hypothetical protein
MKRAKFMKKEKEQNGENWEVIKTDISESDQNDRRNLSISAKKMLFLYNPCCFQNNRYIGY